MPTFAIIEIDDGLTVVEVAEQETAEDAALMRGGIVIDPGPYTSYQDAYDAMMLLPDADDEEQPE